MKNLLLCLATMAIPWFASAQSNHSLILDNVKVSFDGGEPVLVESQELNMSQDRLFTVVLYEKDGMRFLADFEFKVAGKRLKFTRKEYVTRVGDKPITGKMKKDVEFMKVGMSRSIDGKSRENFVLNKDLMQTAFISYDYELKYK